MPSRKEKEQQKREEWRNEQLAELKDYRQRELAKQFSSFIHWKKGNEGVTSLVLNRHLLQTNISCLQENDFINEQELAVFWYRDWKEAFTKYTAKDFKNKYSNNHPLEAYLQKKCFWVARKLHGQYKGNSSFRIFEISDYFNISYLQLNQILIKYDPKKNPNLARYVMSGFKYKVIDRLRELDSRSGKSKNYLLVNASNSRFKKALNAYGVSKKLTQKYIYAWEYYKEIYQQRKVQQGNKYSELNTQELENIFLAIKRANPNLLKDAEQLSDWMNECSSALANYDSVQTESYDRSVDGELGSSSYLELLAEEKELAADNIEQVESDEYSTQLLDKFLEQLIVELEEILKEDQDRAKKGRRCKLADNFDLILELYHGLEINETKIAAFINYFYPQTNGERISQCTISRHRARIISAKNMLGDRLLDWMHNNPDYKIHLKENDFKVAVFVSSIEDALAYYYKSLSWKRYSWLENEIAQLSYSQQELIEIYYGRYYGKERNPVDKLSANFRKSFEEIESLLISLKSSIAERFIDSSSQVNMFQVDSILMNEYLANADANRKTNQKSKITLQDILSEIVDALLSNYCNLIRLKMEEEISIYKLQLPDSIDIEKWLASKISELELSQQSILKAWYSPGISTAQQLDINDLAASKKALSQQLFENAQNLGINLNIYDLDLMKYEQEDTKKIKKIQVLQMRKVNNYLDNFLLQHFNND